MQYRYQGDKAPTATILQIKYLRGASIFYLFGGHFHRIFRKLDGLKKEPRGRHFGPKGLAPASLAKKRRGRKEARLLQEEHRAENPPAESRTVGIRKEHESNRA